MWKQSTQKNRQKYNSCERPFLQCVCYWHNLLREMFFILCNNWKVLFLIKDDRFPEVLFNRHVPVFFEASDSKEFCVSFFLHNTNTGAQSDIFQGRGAFVESEHFDKYLVWKHKEKRPRREIFEFFLQDILKTTPWIESLTQRWKKSGLFFPKSGHFLQFLKKGWGGLPLSPPPLVACL